MDSQLVVVGSQLVVEDSQLVVVGSLLVVAGTQQEGAAGRPVGARSLAAEVAGSCSLKV